MWPYTIVYRGLNEDYIRYYKGDYKHLGSWVSGNSPTFFMVKHGPLRAIRFKPRHKK